MSRFRGAVFAAILAAGVLAASQAAATATDVPPPPAGAEPVPVTTGHTTGDVDVALHPHVAADQSISGQVTDATTGDPIFGIAVPVYLHGHEVTHGVTDTNGDYTVTDLAPSETGYAVCFGARYDPEDPDGGGEPYAGKCLGDGPWMIDAALPSHLVRVPLAAHEHRTGVDVALDREARISGTLTDRDGTRLPGIRVIARSLSDPNVVARTATPLQYPSTLAVGQYRFHNLPPAPDGYEVCFDGFTNHSVPRHGVRRECYGNVPWGHGRMPATATPVSVTPGHTHAHVDATLQPAGRIIARVVSARTGKPIRFVDVMLFSSSGSEVYFDRSHRHGLFHMYGVLPGSGYHLCARPALGLVDLGEASYRPACYRNTSWSGTGPPARATDIQVRRDADTGTLTIALPDAAAIDGVVRTADGTPLARAGVELFDASGEPVQEYPSLHGAFGTDAQGRYHFVGLPAAKGGYIVCAADFGIGPTSTPGGKTGFAPRCTGNTRWTGALDNVSANAEPIPLGAHEQRGGVNLRLPVGGAIAGTITEKGSGTPFDADKITLFDHTGHVVSVSSSWSDGKYQFTGLAASSGYYVCVPGGRYDDGIVEGACHESVPWSGTRAGS